MTTDATVLPEEDESLEPASSSVKAIVGSTLTFIAMVALWEILVVQLKIPAWMLPSPSAIVDAMIDWRSELFGHFMVTLYETLVGFGPVAFFVGIPLAVAVVYSRFLQNTVYPILLALQSMPKVAIAPLLTLWIGFGALPKILVVFLVCSFPNRRRDHVWIGYRLRPVFLELVQALGAASQMQTFIKIRFPTAMPHISWASRSPSPWGWSMRSSADSSAPGRAGILILVSISHSEPRSPLERWSCSPS